MDIFSHLLFFLIVIPSAIFHEYMHGFVADQLGDPTARLAGRLTLNPRAHVDPIGTFLLPLMLLVVSQGNFMFAYAKPVPYNPYNLRYQRLGPFLVAIAGPLSNFFLAIVFAIFAHLLPLGDMTGLLMGIVYVNLTLGVFNLIPIPPLDGSKILYFFLPRDNWQIQATLERYGFIFLIAFLWLGPNLIGPVVDALYRLLAGGLLFF